MPEPTFILVHGAWHGAWCWRDFGAELDRRGVAWRALDLPSSRNDADPTTDLADDASAVAHVAHPEGPVILVGHSYGGAVITEAAPRLGNLVRMVYVAALVPHIGQSASETSRTVKVRTELDNAMEVDGQFVRLNHELAVQALYPDCSPDVRSWAGPQLSTQTFASFRSARRASEVDVPSRYILCGHDHALDPSLQVKLAERCDEVSEIESDHSPFLSHPKQLADALLA